MTNYQSETEKQHIHEKIEELRASVEPGASPTILHNLGVYHSWLGEYEDAIGFYKLAEESKEIYPSATINKYRTYISWAAHLINESLDTEYPDIIQEKLKIAIDLCMKACKSTDREVLTAAHFNIGLAMYLQQDPESAELARREFEHAENSCTDSQIRSLILNNKGVSKSALGLGKWAIQDFESAANLYQGDDPDIHNNIGVASARIAEQFNSKPDLAKARMQFALALQLDENHGDAIHNREELANIEISTSPTTSPINEDPFPEITTLFEKIAENIEIPEDILTHLRVAEELLYKYDAVVTQTPNNNWMLDTSALHYANSGEGLLRIILLPWLQNRPKPRQMLRNQRPPVMYKEFSDILFQLRSSFEFTDQSRIDRLIKIINDISKLDDATGGVRKGAHFFSNSAQTISVPRKARSLILGKYLNRNNSPGMIEVISALMKTSSGRT